MNSIKINGSHRLEDHYKILWKQMKTMWKQNRVTSPLFLFDKSWRQKTPHFPAQKL